MDQFMETHVGTAVCLCLAVILLLCAIVFAVGKEKIAGYISGFSSLSREEQDRYDKARMSRDMRNLYFQLAAIQFAGAALTLVNQYLAIPVFLLWLYWFFKDVHFDIEKAFGKYRL